MITADPTSSSPLHLLHSVECHPERSEGSAFFSFNFELLAHSGVQGSTFNRFSTTPFLATLTTSLQRIENTATLSPFAATLTGHVNHNPFVCHSYKKHPGWGAISDCFAPALALGVCLVRYGCFMSGCDFGRPIDMPWGVIFTNPLAAQLAGTPLGVRLHPSQLYESLLGLGTFLLLLYLSRRPRRTGLFLLIFTSCYAGGRFFLEYFRGDADRLFWGPLSTAQWLPITVMLLLWSFYWMPITHGGSATPIPSQTQVRGQRFADSSR
jgi:Prolipoprotein diacylglyceryl transferase